MKKAVDAFRSIGEVSQLVGVAPHVLRYWEAQFPLFSPVKRRDGRRYYRPEDVKLAAGLCELLREDGVSIRGAKKLMAADRGADLRARGAARLPAPFGDEAAEDKAEATPAPTPATASANPEPVPARRRKAAADRGTLPLFAHLESSEHSGPVAASPTRPTANWLIRLQNLRDALPDLPADDATTAAAATLLARLRAGRQAISA
ncbi:MerR family transcriptional regulator [Paracoccus sp. S1E-3]|uniref:MerR family transcriptional regulator n=1 Tax=Paracoccus sp. S1E-3 TaxID=2756130 RepID=UPI0015EEAB96|nr:MerR family transcriptional regulator [Paracoccus sp. S1E-3]MBA4491222.1 MerR family transcriptional regulator [Paracoccus sp. S1E-3]